MSTQSQKRGLSIPQIRARKQQADLVPLVSLTAYTTPMAKAVAPHADFMLVGDSLGMVLYGMENTLGVTVEMMIAHGQAVMRGAGSTPVIVDMPFGSYEQSPQFAYENATRIMKETGCAGIKLEGGTIMADTINFLTRRGIPVLAHIGLLPQSINNEGGFRAHGHAEAEAERLREDAKAVDAAGAFATVIEGTLEPLAKEMTDMINIPTIGIGASPSCDGQILVTEDMTGLFTDFVPRHVKRYVNLGAQLDKAIADYAEDVKARAFPEMKHCPLPRKSK